MLSWRKENQCAQTWNSGLYSSAHSCWTPPPHTPFSNQTFWHSSDILCIVHIFFAAAHVNVFSSSAAWACYFLFDQLWWIVDVANGSFPSAAASLERFAICWQLGCVSTWKSFPVRALMLPSTGNDTLTSGRALTAAAIFTLCLSYWPMAVISTLMSWHFFPLRKEFLMICVAFILTENRDECSRAQSTLWYT